jgi:hypothetical protein
MATKEIVKKEVAKPEVALSPFVIFRTEIGDIREAIDANVGDAGLSAGDFERIKVPAGGGIAWSVQGLDGEEMIKELSGIIIAWRDTRAYWSLSMEESDGSMPPDCYSMDARTGTGKPGGDCHKCPLAQFGSDPKGEGQACKLIRQLFLIREDNLLPEIVNLPPSSVKPARQYFLRLASKGVPCYSVITKLALEKTKNGQGIVYSKAALTSGGRLTPEQAARAKQYAAMIDPFLKSTPAIPMSHDVADSADGEVV